MSETEHIKSIELERYALLLAEAEAIHGTSLAADAWRRLKKNRVAFASLWFLVILSLLALLTPLLPLQSPFAIDIQQAYAPPTVWPPFIESLRLPGTDAVGGQATEDKSDWIDTQFGDLSRVNRWLTEARVKLIGRWSINSICGRDELGRDELARLFWGARISLAVGLVATLVSLAIGVSYGAISGYCGGRIDNLMMRFVDVLYCVPFIFVVIFLITILSQEDIQRKLESFGIDRITIFFLVVGAIYWLTMARVVRGQVLSLKHEQFVEAARTIGAKRGRILFLHIVPNLLSVIIVYLTLTIPRVMLFEACLSFLGLGVQAPNVSWGLLANQGFHVITPVKIFWWPFVFPSLAMGMTLFALNFLGDGLRDALDPRLKNK
jgi:oligopeptide transport system permease protein